MGRRAVTFVASSTSVIVFTIPASLNIDAPYVMANTPQHNMLRLKKSSYYRGAGPLHKLSKARSMVTGVNV